MCHDRRALAQRLQCRQQLDVARSAIDTHDAAPHVNVCGVDALELRQCLRDEPPILLPDERLDREHHLHPVLTRQHHPQPPAGTHTVCLVGVG